MNVAVTFFRDRENDSGETYQLELTGTKETTHVFVYAQRTFESRALQNQLVSSSKERDLTLHDLRTGLTTSGGGGVIVTMTDEGRWRTFAVTKINARPYQGPDQCHVIAPGQPPALLATDGNRAKFPAGSHLLVPVNPEAEQRLQDFVAYLGWLSPDLESLVLNAIRRPSLDKRLELVEKQIATSGNRPADDLRGFARVKSMLNGAVPPPLIRVAAAVLLLLLLGVNGALLYGLHSHLDEDTTGGGWIGHAPKASPLAKETKTLLEAVRARQSSDPLLRQVARVHFGDLDAPAWKDDPPFLMGLIKLQLLQFVEEPKPDLAFLKSADSIEATNETYRDVKAAVANDSRADRLLAALACRVESKPELAFRGDCKDLSDKDIERGLRGLTDFVEGRPR